MKKFLVSFIIGITMMAIGTTMLIFEIKDFKIVDGVNFKDAKNTHIEEFDVSKADLDIRFENGQTCSYRWEYDEGMKDTVRVQLQNDVEYRVRNHAIHIESVSYRDEYEPFEYLNMFIEGLKDKKLYTLEGDDTIVFTSSSDARDRVNFIYD